MRGDGLETVWILGAGFSRGVGGPLLSDVFSPHLQSEVQHWLQYKGKKIPGKHVEMLHFYRHCSGVKLYQHYPPVPIWRNPEEFLDRLDNAANSPRDSQQFVYMLELFHRVTGKTKVKESALDELRATAIHWFSAECCRFWSDVDIRTERWTPYVEWIQSLRQSKTSHHRLITFNYDRVLEIASNDSLDVVLPDAADCRKDGIELFKLHGSVDWERTEGNGWKQSDNPFFAVTGPIENTLIATPGPTKGAFTGGQLNALWLAAERAIVGADQIYFIGYRFPETDSEARRRILLAIRRNRKTALKIGVVLGPDTRSSDVQRLTGLLDYAVRGLVDPQVCVLPMWAEDFLTVYPFD